MGPKLLLIINKKSYMHFRLTPKGMTLDNFEHQNTGFIDFLRF